MSDRRALPVRTPVRTCVGCRERAPKSVLLRVVVAEDSTIVPDPDGRLPGRGAYLHPVMGCLDLAVRRRAFARALRVPGAPDVARVVTHLGGDTGSDDTSSAAGQQHRHRRTVHP